MNLSYDLVVLGGGSAGYSAALRARQLGMTVALVEGDKVGGTCLHRGCVPTKALVYSSEIAHVSKEAAKFGVLNQFTGVDMPAMKAFKDGIVSGKYKGLQGLLKAKGIELHTGFGKLTGPNTVQVGDQTLTGKNILLATGSVSRSLPGLEIGGRVITSDNALELDYLPSKVIVLGGGVIGVEFASIWNALGVEVTIVEALPHLVPNEDEAISKQLERAFKRRGIAFSLGVRFSSVAQSDTGVEVTLEDGKTFSADLLLVAVGRGPATQGIGLEEVGVATDRGFVLVDERLATNIPTVYAAGDITPGVQLAHRGYQQGIYVAEQIAGLNPPLVSDLNIPKITYTEPEVASIGYSEAKAKEVFGADQVSSYEYNLSGNAKSSILGTGGIVKVVQHKDKEVLGVHMIGSRVSELISEAQLIVNWEAFPVDIAPLIHAHPTQGEALGEAMMALAGRPLHGV